ncbi:tryptophan synthase beta subunit-like PLP-dependent enzyme [Lentinula detonsa]|uniref:Tryptophan synthase beta subunit-like PLP-dependent enzyme n=1 Tax=Lentinula detonsa TaxID=2804962 RepID=A0AA38PV83_9AGAR|nr:tryptophan synthase beta subunit-like PLP-dependent enzyme [Lentinula detonsa]
MDPLNLPPPFSEIPRQTLLFGSSPIHRLDRISDDLSSTFSGYKVDVYAKRDDCNSALAFGGNKMRKLEYLLAEALEQGADTLVKLVQENWVDYPSPIYSKIGNIQLSRLMGADPHLDYQSTFGIEHKPTTASLTAQVISEGGKPYYIPAGASDHPLGGLGFARWSFEVYAQEKELGVFFDTVVVCAVSGSTLAGMVAGFKLLEKTFPEDGERLNRRKVIGIDASAKPSSEIAKVTAEKVGLGENEIREEDIVLDERYHAGAYGIPDKQTIEAIRLYRKPYSVWWTFLFLPRWLFSYGARMDAFITDPVYEGKSLAGMIDMIRKGEICPQDGEKSTNVLYAHLGGQPALNVYWDMEERIIV